MLPKEVICRTLTGSLNLSKAQLFSPGRFADGFLYMCFYIFWSMCVYVCGREYVCFKSWLFVCEIFTQTYNTNCLDYIDFSLGL